MSAASAGRQGRRPAAHRRRVVHRRVGGGRPSLRHQAVPPARTIGDLDRAAGQLVRRVGRHVGHRPERVRRPGARHRRRRCVEFRADALPGGARTGHTARHRLERDSDHRDRARAEQHVRQHDRGAPPHHGHDDRLVHRVGERGEGPASGQRHPHGTDALVRRVAERHPRQDADPQCRAVPLHRGQDRRTGSGDHRVRRRVLRRQPERARVRHHVERRRIANRRLVGLRGRCVRRRSHLLPRRCRHRAVRLADSPCCADISVLHTPTNTARGLDPGGATA